MEHIQLCIIRMNEKLPRIQATTSLLKGIKKEAILNVSPSISSINLMNMKRLHDPV